jgi:hypothetical protein
MNIITFLTTPISKSTEKKIQESLPFTTILTISIFLCIISSTGLNGTTQIEFWYAPTFLMMIPIGLYFGLNSDVNPEKILKRERIYKNLGITLIIYAVSHRKGPMIFTAIALTVIASNLIFEDLRKILIKTSKTPDETYSVKKQGKLIRKNSITKKRITEKEHRPETYNKVFQNIGEDSDDDDGEGDGENHKPCVNDYLAKAKQRNRPLNGQGHEWTKLLDEICLIEQGIDLLETMEAYQR